MLPLNRLHLAVLIVLHLGLTGCNDRVPSCVAFSPDGANVVIGDRGGQIRILNLATGTVVRSTRAHDHRVASIRFLPSADGIVSSGIGHEVTIWNYPALSHRTSWPLAGKTFAVSPDGETLATTMGDRRRGFPVDLWAVDSTMLRLTIRTNHGHYVRAMAFSPDGSLLATGSRDGTVKVWRVDSGEEEMSLMGEMWDVWDVLFSRDGNRIIAATRAETIDIWDLATRRRLARLEGHTGDVFCLALAPDGDILASASWDGSVRLWDLRKKVEIAIVRQYDSGLCDIAFSPDGKLLRIVVGRRVEVEDVQRLVR